jgi:multiple sugar transport system permease protein
MRRRGQVPLWTVIVLSLLALLILAWWTYTQTRTTTQEGREPIVFWGSRELAPGVYNAVHLFEQRNPQYRVVMSTAVARSLTDDAQRLICAVAGGVPPDLVWFDRFAIGEWASRGALTDLRAMLDAQSPDDPYRIDLTEYYEWAVAEASYAPPGSGQTPGVYGIPTNADVRAFFVNLDVLRQAGLVDAQGHPKPPRTWEELLDYSKRLTLYRTPGDPSSGIVRLGFAPSVGNSWLYLFSWQAGGEMLSADGRRVTMNSPENVRALKYMTSLYDACGGVGQVDAYRDAQQQGGSLDPLLNGQLAMKIDGDAFLGIIAEWKPQLDFAVLPAPMPADRLAAGVPPVTWSGGWSVVIPSTSRNKTGAFKLMQFLNSEEGIRILERGRRDEKESQGRLYLPRPLANQRLHDMMVRETVELDPKVPAPFKRAFEVFRDLRPNTRIRPVTPIGQLLWNQHVRATDAGVNHTFADQARQTGRDESELALATMQVDAQRALDRLLSPPPPTIVHWRPILLGYAALVALPFLLMWIVYRRRRREHGYRAREVGAALLFLSPWAIGFVVLVGGPIVFSVIISFTRYDVLSPARYVGLGNYHRAFTDPVFYKSLFNTLFMVIQIPLGMALSLAVALLLNRGIRAIGLYRAAFYLPVVMPLVATTLLWTWLLNPNHGAVNSVLAWLIDTPPARWIEQLVSLFSAEPFQFTLPGWIRDPAWSKPSIILMNLWKAGGGMIIWLAGLQSIPPDLYEAASIDGAGAWRRFRHITVPMLSPFILFNLIIGLIGTMQIFTEAYILTAGGAAGGPADSTLFYAYYLFVQAFQFFNMGYASAMAWVLFLIVLVLTLAQFWLSGKWVHYERS